MSVSLLEPDTAYLLVEPSYNAAVVVNNYHQDEAHRDCAEQKSYSNPQNRQPWSHTLSPHNMHAPRHLSDPILRHAISRE